jgi:hypothetical protein
VSDLTHNSQYSGLIRCYALYIWLWGLTLAFGAAAFLN